MFKIVKLMTVLVIVCSLITIFSINYGIIPTSKTNHVPKSTFTIVLDAGHGGIDGGSVGSFLTEAEVNLDISKALEQYLTAFGIRVVQTRTNDNSLAISDGDNFKQRDMQARKKIIDTSNCDLVISIHCNKFVTKSERGAQVYYQAGSSEGKLLADSIQQQIIKNLPYGRKFANFGDFFITDKLNVPSVIVECGFLSNDEEEKLLSSTSYKNIVAYTIFCGIINYFFNISK